MRARHWIAAWGLAAVVSACAQAPPRQDVFTPAHDSTSSAVREFFGVRSTAVQPIAFPHRTHVQTAKLGCADYCHETVAKSSRAGLPSVKTCMICHESIATDRPLVQQVADYQKRGVEIPWQRVYGFARSAHVRFDHAPHVRASVECATCHGNVAGQTVAEPSVEHTMKFCVDCHRTRKASNDCLTCHY